MARGDQSAAAERDPDEIDLNMDEAPAQGQEASEALQGGVASATERNPDEIDLNMDEGEQEGEEGDYRITQKEVPSAVLGSAQEVST